MTRLIQFANNAVSNLAGSLTTSGTTLTVTAGEGAKFPALTGTQYFMATLIRTDGATEIVKVTARSTDTFTISRTAEPVGGLSTAYAYTAGDRIELRMTSGAISGELDRLDAAAFTSPLNKSANYTILEADKTSLVRVTTTSGAITVTLPSIAALADDFDVVVAKVTSDANTVTLARSSSDLINGNASYVLTSQWQSVWLIADRSTNTWTAINSGATSNVVADSGTGSGSATLTLSGDPGSKNNVALFIGSVYQQKSTYSVSGTTLTAGAAVPSGVAWEAVWTAPSSIGTPADGTVSTIKIVDAAITAIKLAAGAVVAHLGFTPLNKAGDTLTGALNEAQGADIASATSINLTTATGNYVNVTGTTAITGITLAQGAERTVKFAAALTLTNGASLILPSGANITTAAGDVAKFRGEAAGVRCVSYMKATGQALVSPTLATVATTGSYTDLINQPTIPAAGVTTFNSRNGAVTLTTADVGTANAGFAYGAVGTYALLKINSTGITEGSTFAGSSLFPAAFDTANNTDSDSPASGTAGGTAVSGTWRLMGRNNAVSGSAFARYSVFLRIA